MAGAPAAAPDTATRRTARDWHGEVRARQRRGDLDGAIDLLRRLIEAAPHIERLRRDLVVLLRLNGRVVDADRLAVELDPSDSAAWARLSQHARIADDVELAVASALGWEAAEPHDPVVGHFAAVARALRDGADHERAPDGYLRRVFDEYADRFDAHLTELGYRAPQVAAALLHGLIEDGDLPCDASVADLGCGTGLVGHHLRVATSGDGAPRWSGSLAGADLAPRMLTRAAERRVGGRSVYDELVEADLVSFLDARPGRFGAVVATDTFIYVGDLRPAFAASIASLRPGGWLVATVEHACEGQATERGYLPDLSGRFLHDASWVERELDRAGFDPVVVDDLSIRNERRRPVPGLVIVARRPPA